MNSACSRWFPVTGVAFAMLCVSACGGGKKADLSDVAGSVKTASGLQYVVLSQGSGAVAEPGKIVSVQYTGWLTNGEKFDSSKDRNQPYDFPLGQGRVIRGWDEGIAGMKVGERRKLVIPPDIGYGEAGRGPVIPGGATLIFEVELMGVK